MIKKIFNHLIYILKNNNLFVKIFILMLVSIVSVTLLITVSTLRMSSTLFVDTFTISNTKMLNQIKTRFESFSYAIVNAANGVQNNGIIKSTLTENQHTSLGIASSYYVINEQMEKIYSHIYPFDTNMLIMGNSEYQLFNMNYSSWPISWNELQEHTITKNTIKHPKRLLYQFDDCSSLDKEPRIIATRALTERSTNNFYGILFFSIKEKDFKTFYEPYTGVGNDILMINQDGIIISSNREDWIGQKAYELLKFSQDLVKKDIEYLDVNIFNNDYLLMSEYLPTFDMYIVNLVNKTSMMNNLIDRSEIILISIGIALLAVIILFIITRRMTKSLSQLVQEISTLAEHNFKKKISVTRGYEAKKIADAFNYMLNELQEYVDIVVQTQKRQREAELRALQHQINPHFLYNTLTSVKFIVEKGQTKKATDMIHALISLLQSALGNINQMVTIKEELKNTKNYVFINQSRYGERIKVNYFVAPDCLHYHIPKLVIQPFIENAFFHAFNKKKEGVIQVLIAKKSQRLVCEIIDNGDGMTMEEQYISNDNKKKRQLFSGIGIRNVQERIQLLYGTNYGVDISSELNKGTRVKIDFPLISKETETL